MFLNGGLLRNSEYLERFFRNLLLGENNELRNRYMVVNAPEELAVGQEQPLNRTSTEQPTEQVRALLFALSNEQFNARSPGVTSVLHHGRFFVLKWRLFSSAL